ncbi:DUF3857 domain-containing protein [Marinifilum sp. N1E240]|uniref:DUF3857 domain-containing protein n=1 Tax=Marinifilum sp. N1E240 TaxID=2608082 RepID=UPI00128AE44C|nr:DUF3857 domain-containing protein [Marinifilum sp. N1E240]MPQ46472.1 DUF3857 domain-containing protein [Marinifilum sp. N1E240]
MKHLTIIKLLVLSFVFISSTSNLYAIKDPIKYGKVSMDELKMTTYEKDTTATAVYLCDYGVSKIQYEQAVKDFKYTYTRIYRIKILKDEGLDYANLEFGFNKNRYDVSMVKGCTYNLENGKISKTKINSKDRILEKTSDDYFTYKLALANVKPGSVIEFKYQLSSNIPWNLDPWYFQKDIPVLHSEFRAYLPEYFVYKKNGKGYLPFKVNEHTYSTGNMGSRTYTVDNYRFVVSDAPAFKKEPYTTTSKNYKSAIEFEIAGTKDGHGVYHDKTGNWDKINTSLMEHSYFGSQLKGGGFLKEVVEEINSTQSSDEEKMLAAFNYIKTNMKWNEYYGKFVTTSLRAAFKEKKGNVADINLMLVVLLNKLGLNTDPVILSTRNNGLLSLFSPSQSKFNYVIASCKLNDKRFFLDATEKNCPCDLLPERCINDKGRVISSSGSYFVDIKTNSISRTATIAKMNLSEDGIVSGNLSLSLNGFAAFEYREALQDQSEDELLETMDEAYKTLNVESAEFKNLKAPEKNLISSMDVELVEELDITNNLIYFNPFIVSKIESNPFTLEERKYPVDYTYPTDKTYLLELIIPEGYTLESKPAPTRINLPEKSGQYLYNVAAAGNKIMITSRFKINKRQFLFDEYASLKEFYNLIVAKNAEMIVLKKM